MYTRIKSLAETRLNAAQHCLPEEDNSSEDFSLPLFLEKFPDFWIAFALYKAANPDEENDFQIPESSE